MAKVEFLVSYGMKFPDGSSVAKGSIALDDKKHKGLVDMLDASKGAARVEPSPSVPEPATAASEPPPAPPVAPVAEEIKELPPEEPEKGEEPDWKYMQKSELKNWLSATGVKMPRDNASHKTLVASCAKAWSEGSR